MPGPRPPLARVIAALAGAIAVLPAVAGCGYTKTVGNDRTLQVAVREFRITPQDIGASPGALTLVVHNYGRLTHNLVIALGAHRVLATPPIPPGQTASISTTLVKGTYLLTSTVLSDQAMGAYGTLRVG